MEKTGYVARKQQKTRYDDCTGGTVSRGGSGGRGGKGGSSSSNNNNNSSSSRSMNLPFLCPVDKNSRPVAPHKTTARWVSTSTAESSPC